MNVRVLAVSLVFTLSPAAQDTKPSAAQLRERASAAWQARDWEKSAELYRAIVKQDDRDAEAWHHLGYALHALGKLDEALAAHQKAAEFPATKVKGTYNVACVHAMKGNKDEAFEWLRRAVDAGFKEADHLRQDEDLASLRDDPRFARMLAFLDSDKDRKNVAIFVHEGVELLDFAGPGEVFAAARLSGKGPAFRVYTVADSTGAITSQRFLTVTPQYTLENCPKPDVVVLPGGATRIPLQNPKVIAWVKETSTQAEVVLSVCTGAFLLAKAGMLDGLEATTHHSAIAGLQKEAPKTTVHADRRFVDNGKVVTAAGVSAGIDAALHVVSRMLGEDSAKATAKYMEYAWQPEPAASRPR
jgi:putative intracellular protease/amidase